MTKQRAIPAHDWTCFHCGETLNTSGTAREHFRPTPDWKPECIDRNSDGGALVLRTRNAELMEEEMMEDRDTAIEECDAQHAAI